MQMKKVIRRMKSSNKTKNIGKISASEFDGKANYDFHQIRKNSEDEKQEEQRCDIATEDTMSCVLSFNTSESNNDSARDDDVSTTEMKNEPLQPSKRNIEIDKEITSNQHTFFLSKLEKRLKENIEKSQGEMNPQCAETLVQMGNIFLSRSREPDNEEPAKDARRAKACFMVASTVYRKNSMHEKEQEAKQSRNKARELEAEFTQAHLEEGNSDCIKLSVDVVPTTSENSSNFWSRIFSLIDSLIGDDFLLDCCSHRRNLNDDAFCDGTMSFSNSYTDTTELSYNQKSWDDFSSISRKSTLSIK